ncbi:hypothetical protein NL676_021723 [Syzygium grande]|nr:hypothetical protein NL676_021723 [Syzygium grande]
MFGAKTRTLLRRTFRRLIGRSPLFFSRKPHEAHSFSSSLFLQSLKGLLTFCSISLASVGFVLTITVPVDL